MKGQWLKWDPMIDEVRFFEVKQQHMESFKEAFKLWETSKGTKPVVQATEAQPSQDAAATGAQKRKRSQTPGQENATPNESTAKTQTTSKVPKTALSKAMTAACATKNSYKDTVMCADSMKTFGSSENFGRICGI